MTRMHTWWLAAAMATAIGCGGGSNTAPPPPPPPGDAGEDVKGTDVTSPEDRAMPQDRQMPPDDQQMPPADVSDTGMSGDTGMSCAAGETRCGDICVDVNNNLANCGMCGRACMGTQICRMGMCTEDMPCMMGQTRCGMTCVNTATDAMNCGACGNACTAGQMCVGGTCATDVPCPMGQSRCGGACTDTMTDSNNCGACGTACPIGQSCMGGTCRATTVCPMPGQTACGGSCVNLQTDIANCGACGMACPMGQVCTAGTCGAMPCPMGETRCGMTCVNTNTDVLNCGMCARTCAMGQTCVAGTCMGEMMCMPGQTRCGSGATASCADLMIDTANCGMCGRACSAGETCMGGTCRAPRMMCPTGQTDCAPMAPTPMCVDLSTSNTNCGACGTACPTGQTCQMGACVCAMGQTLCGRTCVNTQSDSNNCGACGTVCPTGQTCQMGRCACAMGQTLCGGVCVDTQSSNANCGGCGMACPMGQTCQMGACRCPMGQTACGTGPALRCVDTQTDRANCGACGMACAMGQTCTAGRCACPTGQMLCGTGSAASCVDTNTNASHCGGCGRACMPGMSCMGGMCRGMPPANDTREGATRIDLSTPSTTIMADTTTATNNTRGTCGCTSGNDLFYTFTLSQPEIVYADTLGAMWDTSLFFQDMAGNNVTAVAPFVACNDDAASAGICPIGGLQTQVIVRLAPGTYFLVLSGCGSGPAQIKFQHLPAGNGPSVRITPNATVQTATGTTAGTGTVSSMCCSGGPDNSYWWVTCPGTAAAAFNATSCSATTGMNQVSYDNEIAQYSALRGAMAQVCNDDVGFVCSTGSNVNSTIPATVANQAGLNTLIADSCSGAGAYTINYVLNNCASGARCGAICADTNTDANHCGGCNRRCAAGEVCRAGACIARPPNDLPTMPTIINMALPQSIFTVNTAAAVNNVSGSCGCTSGNDVFYQFTIDAGQAEIIYADTIGSSFDTSLFVQTAAGVNITVPNLPANGIACNDDFGLPGCDTGRQSQIMLRLEAGTYRLVLSGCGSGAATLRFQHAPIGNGPIAFLNAGSSTPGGTVSGTGRVNLGCGGGGPENTYYWYRCASATTPGAFTASTCGRATWDTTISQYSPGRSSPGANVCADDSCGLQSSVSSTIPAGAGLHMLYIDTFTGRTPGTYTVAVTRP